MLDLEKNLMTCDLGGTKLLVRLCIEGQCIDRKYATGIDFSPAELTQIISQLEQEYSLQENYPIAIAFPGLLNHKKCFVSNVVPQFDGFDLNLLTNKGNLKLVLNDVEAGTYGIIKNAQGVEILIMSGTGIGMGIAIDGKVFRGQNGFSGELGSCRLPHNGSYQRLAKLASGSACYANDNFTKETCGRDLGMAVSWVVNCFNPGRIVFAGGMFNEAEYQQACFNTIEQLSLQQSFEKCQLELEPEMHSIVVRGLSIALQQLDAN
ncbi:MAG: ROK family protein [Kangiellaceae bacterium]|nr:ROK family protein [Kangiellaceae bacterium]MCW8998722.1 ROK family protein [Kangiellaceae bacterium]MCW9016528.1 ROK family protein [Kangiellaceae bacterium]